MCSVECSLPHFVLHAPARDAIFPRSDGPSCAAQCTLRAHVSVRHKYDYPLGSKQVLRVILRHIGDVAV